MQHFRKDLKKKKKSQKKKLMIFTVIIITHIIKLRILFKKYSSLALKIKGKNVGSIYTYERN